MDLADRIDNVIFRNAFLEGIPDNTEIIRRYLELDSAADELRDD